MGISFPQYVGVKNKYCCAYLGDSPDYVISLKLIKPQIEKHFPEIQFFISCKDNLMYLLEGESQIISISDLNHKKSEFSYIRDVRNDFKQHSILEFIEESFMLEAICETSNFEKGICLICPEGVPPVKPLTYEQIENYKKKLQKEGNVVLILGSDVHSTLSDIKIRPIGHEKFTYISEAKLVIGVENEYTMLAASQGKRVLLDGSGLGVRLYKNMFPKIELI